VSEQQPGRVITFYSFKGGTGRSMALANIATTIAQRNGNRVLAIDWDLEAPGLHRYFRPYLKLTGTSGREEQISDSPGLIELLGAVHGLVRSSSTKLSRKELVTSAFERTQLDDFLLPTDLPTLSFLKAGKFDSSYSSRINSFDWADLFESQPEFFGAFADYLASRFTHVLIDSRTGYTDISGICTSLLPDTLVAVFTPNLQSLCGALEMSERAVIYRVGSDDLRPLRIFPLVSRVELSELKLNDSWRFGDAAQDIEGYQPQFEQTFERLYGIESCDLTAYFDLAQVAYVPYYAFGEKIAARSEESGTIRLSRNFSELADVLMTASTAWEIQRGGQDLEQKPEVPWDAQWFDSQWRPPSFAAIEARASLSRVRPSTLRSQLLSAIRGAAVPSNIFTAEPAPVLSSPPQDAVNAAIVTTHGQYGYWVLRINGDCLLIRPLPQKPNPLEIVAKQLVESIAETLLSYRRLYANLGVTPRADLRIDIRMLASSGTVLFVPATPYGGLHRKARTILVQPVASVEEVVLGRIEHDLLALTKHFAEPLIASFEGSQLSDETYQLIVSEFLASVS
jgi:hypothetical protein